MYHYNLRLQLSTIIIPQNLPSFTSTLATMIMLFIWQQKLNLHDFILNGNKKDEVLSRSQLTFHCFHQSNQGYRKIFIGPRKRIHKIKNRI